MEAVFWSNLAFVICWMAGWGYVAHLFIANPSRFGFRKRSTLAKNRTNLIAVVGLLVAPFFWVNFHQDNGYYDYKRHFDKVTQDGTIADVTAFHKAAIQLHPSNVRVNIEYIIFAYNHDMKSWLIDRADFYQEKIKEGVEVEKFQLLSHLGSIYTGLHRFDYNHGHITDVSLQGLFNFVSGEVAIDERDIRTAQDYFIKALQDEELVDLAYARLESMWRSYYSLEELSEFAYNMDLFPYMPFNIKRKIYIEDGSWGWYLFNGIYRDFLSADLAAYLAVSFSMFVWLLFVAQMLFIQRKMWKLIIPLFVLGAILPVGVYVLGDFLRFLYGVLSIELKHNDLAYCIVNIGMNEELIKTLPWLIIFLIYRKRFHRPVHFMLLPVISALGFAFSENLIYVNSNDYELVFARSGISLIVHLSCSATIGYMTWRATLKRNGWIKTGYVVGGFLLASVIHGLYDFIIFNGGSYMSIFMLLLALHLFILFTNNAINFSGIMDRGAIRKLRQSGVILLVGMIAIFLMQYLIIGWNFSPSAANHMFLSNIIIALVTTVYLVIMFSRVRLRPRVLYHFSIGDVFGQFIKTSKGNYMDEVDYLGWKFRLFAPKTNPFVGSQLPITVTAVRRVVVQGNLNWWLVSFEEPLRVGGTDPMFAIMKAKVNDEDLFMDKAEVILLMIPSLDEFNTREKHHSKDFVYTDRVYSRPVFVPIK